MADRILSNDDLDIANRTTCEFEVTCTNEMHTWTSFYGDYYPVCKEHMAEAVSF